LQLFFTTFKYQLCFRIVEFELLSSLLSVGKKEISNLPDMQFTHIETHVMWKNKAELLAASTVFHYINKGNFQGESSSETDK
jgi:hypothetical protein